MNKRGQLTIFIIAAVLIVGLFILGFFLLKSKNEVPTLYVDSIKNYVDACVKQTGEDAIAEIGKHGGYYFPPVSSTRTGIAYYYANKTNMLPSQSVLEDQISLYVKENLFFCTKNFVDFTNYNVTQGNISVETTISKDKVDIKVNYPLTISQGEEVSRIDSFENEINVRLGLIYNSIASVVNSSTSGICLSCTYDIANKNDLYVQMLDYNQNTVIVIFIDKNSEINKEEYRYVYAVQN